jgi:hypothetical protein
MNSTLASRAPKIAMTRREKITSPLAASAASKSLLHRWCFPRPHAGPPFSASTNSTRWFKGEKDGRGREIKITFPPTPTWCSA